MLSHATSLDPLMLWRRPCFSTACAVDSFAFALSLTGWFEFGTAGGGHLLWRGDQPVRGVVAAARRQEWL